MSTDRPCRRPAGTPAHRVPLVSAMLAALLLAGCETAPQAPPGRLPLMHPLRKALDPTPPASAAALPAAAPVAAPAAAPVAAPATAPKAAAARRPAPPATPPATPAPAAVAAVPSPISPAVPVAVDPAGVLPPEKAERRFSVVLNNATPEVVFMSLLAETPLSVAVDPSFKGPLSISLRDVTLREALDLLRELHGLEYKVIGRHILVSPAQLQTRLFTVDFPSFNRQGRSELRVVSGSITGSGAGTGSTNSSGGNTQGGNGGSAVASESSHVTTSQRSDLWNEIEASVRALVGSKDGAGVVASPQTGNLVVRAMPREMRAVQDYLAGTRAHVERQVMLEAKVVEVQLRDSERAGINWAAFASGLNSRLSLGVVGPGVTLAGSGAIGSGSVTATPGSAIQAAATNTGALLGLAFQTSHFATVLDFLGTQGAAQVLSSPRIATVNNQKAVLKVGTDDFFVTSISTTTTPVGNTTSTTPTIGVTPFFSGISLDVTPSIDANGVITLHIHPSVSTVSERTKVLNLGTLGTYSLPLASSDINESDAVVRARDGQIIAIGGLMRQSATRSDSGIPGTEGSIWRRLLGGQAQNLTEKRELVILLKPTVLDPNRDEGDGRADALQRLLDWTEGKAARAP